MRAKILVTGGNRGIGLAIATALAEQEYEVLLGCRDILEGVQAAANIRGSVFPVHLDLSNPVNLSLQVEKLLSIHPRIDGLVNNAGVLDKTQTSELNAAQMVSSMQVNCFAAHELMRQLVPLMNQRAYGRVVNVSSGWGSFNEGLQGPTAYSVSKAALNALTLSWSKSSEKGVLINSMCPGWVKTRMGGDDAELAPEEAAKTALWLINAEEDGPNGGFFRNQKAIDW
ncbi:SDR family NAD(P)-dependent oxidoreductase [Alginatibacterium sediminis]|uniref:SDR family NAD(P)-dependent oxidoreductase n=1 Tax=Alginatibacterium sediminis TaxID=2164068 RepID=A0A420ENG7_9ALTE|nr:SDR family NAD(P)-dependent oxidoreductase [Alginatibacterium sediminis]RKF22230.1 SDR family NAD(P)-dependent oxidoreductase [Alginatibacterium sediminis]